MSTTDIKCNFTLQMLLAHEFLRQVLKCLSCSHLIGTHPHEIELENKFSKSNMDDQDANDKMKDKINCLSERSVTGQKNSTSLSPPDISYRSKTSPASLSSSSSASRSIKSSASAEARDHIYLIGAHADDNQTIKKKDALATKLKREAMLAASDRRTFLCKEFLRKHYCVHIKTNNYEELYMRILSITKNDAIRVYHLMEHARHSCLDLITIANNDQQIIDLFQFLNNFLPYDLNK